MARLTKVEMYQELITLFGLTNPFDGMVDAPTPKWSPVEIVDAILRELGHIEACGRCGGGGHYSFNLMHGTRCFGCGGKGTKVAKMTPALYREVVAEHADGKVAAIQARNHNLRALRCWSNRLQRFAYADDAAFVADERAQPTAEWTVEGWTFRVRGGAVEARKGDATRFAILTDFMEAVAWMVKQGAELTAAEADTTAA